MHIRRVIIGGMAAVLIAAPAWAAPKVVTLSGPGADDPLMTCRALAGSPYEDGAKGIGVGDDADVFLTDALAACEAAHETAPDSAEAMTWLGRVYVIMGRYADGSALLDEAVTRGNVFAAYLRSKSLASDSFEIEDRDSDRAAELLQQAADAGFAPAMADRARQLVDGYDDKLGGNYAAALPLYQAASDKGLALATYRLGDLYRNGYGVEQDFRKAMDLYEAAAAAGEPLGHFGAGQLYQFGEGVPADLALSAAEFQKGADKGEMSSEAALAYFYDQGQGVEKDETKAFVLLTDAANQNYAPAQASLSLHYLYGEGVAADPAKALDLADRAAQANIPFAQGIAGYIYAEGLGTDRDLETAKMYFERGAEGGDQFSTDRVKVTEAELACKDAAASPDEPGGYGMYGVAFASIKAGPAIAACQTALELNSGSAGDKAWLARALLKAGRAKDAAPLLEDSAAAGNVLAEMLLGDMLATGKGAPADPDRAIELYQAAAEKDFVPAQLALGNAYAKGTLVTADIPTALKWYDMASSNGSDEADAAIKRLGGKRGK